jgi:hypothetical protein
LRNRLTVWLGALIVVIVARVFDRVMDEMRVARPRPPRNCTEAQSWGLQDIPRGSPYYAPRIAFSVLLIISGSAKPQSALFSSLAAI